jgi:four helix bundle protein
VTLKEWERIVPEAMRLDPRWKMSAYRKALYVADIGWQDVTKLVQDRRTLALSDQLCRSLGSMSANLAEGYSRGTGSDRARFYEYALGSARESADWYFKARHILGDAVVEDRIRLVAEIIRLLLATIPRQRARVMREEARMYQAGPDGVRPEISPADEDDGI